MGRKLDDLTAIDRWRGQSVEQPAPPYVPDELGPCLVWRGTLFNSGYGCVRYGGRYHRLHRIAWIIRRGEPPVETPLVLHRCDVRTCWSDQHLWLGTQAQNCIDMVIKNRHVNTRKTHCKRGHPYDGDNLWTEESETGRRCRTCARERMRQLQTDPEHRAKKREWDRRHANNKRNGTARKYRVNQKRVIVFLLGMAAGAVLVLGVIVTQAFLLDHHKGENSDAERMVGRRSAPQVFHR